MPLVGWVRPERGAYKRSSEGGSLPLLQLPAAAAAAATGRIQLVEPCIRTAAAGLPNARGSPVRAAQSVEADPESHASCRPLVTLIGPPVCLHDGSALEIHDHASPSLLRTCPCTSSPLPCRALPREWPHRWATCLLPCEQRPAAAGSSLGAVSARALSRQLAQASSVKLSTTSCNKPGNAVVGTKANQGAAPAAAAAAAHLELLDPRPHEVPHRGPHRHRGEVVILHGDGAMGTIGWGIVR